MSQRVGTPPTSGPLRMEQVVELKGLMDELRKDHGWTFRMFAEFLGLETEKIAGDLFTGKGAIGPDMAHLLAVRYKVEKLRHDLIASRERRTPAKRSDAKSVSKKRKAKKTTRKKADKLGGPTMDATRRKVQTLQIWDAMKFMADATGATLGMQSRMFFDDPTGKFLDNLNMRRRDDSTLTERTIKKFSTNFSLWFGFRISDIGKHRPGDFAYLKKQAQEAKDALVSQRASKAAATRKGWPAPPPAEPVKPTPPKPAQRSRDIPPAEEADVIPIKPEAPMEAPDFDHRIARVRTLLLEASTELQECAVVAPTFGGLKAQITQLGSLIEDAIQQWWADEPPAES